MSITEKIAVLGVMLTVVGWFANNWLIAAREHKNRKEEMRIEYLMEAFDKLSFAANRPELTPEFARMMEIAISKIQLFGTAEEIRLVHEFLDEWRESEKKTGQPRGSFDPILFELRNSLRAALSQDPIDGPVRWIRPLGGHPQST